jgi:hypothetical protein
MHEENAMTYPIRAIFVAAMLPVLAAAPGCATSKYKTMTREQQAAIRSVSISKSVLVPEHPTVIGPSASTSGFIFGPLALAGSMSGDNPDSQALKKLFADQKVDLGKIVRQEFIARLAQIRAFPEIDVAQGDATFELTIENYGLGAAGFTPMSPINHPLNPTIRLAAKLTTRDGEVLWQSNDYVTSMNDQLEPQLFDEILANPERTQEGFRKAAEIVCKYLLKDFATHPAAVN